MNQNPFSLTFGKEPSQMISRFLPADEILSNFKASPSPQQIFMITGVRGSGKTVFMTTIAKKLAEEPGWIVLELNAAGELLLDLAAKLYNTKGMPKVFQAAGIDLSFWGIGVGLKKADPLTDLETAISRMLEKLKDKGKRLLITIDEVSNTRQMRIFASAFQIFVRQDHPLYLLMTGLYENISALQNEKQLTFLYRAPKIYLRSLNLSSIARTYQTHFPITENAAREMARLTLGYPFAFQVLGYFTFEQKGDYETSLPSVKEYLDEYVYEKLWSELSAKERRILTAMATEHAEEVKVLKETLGLKPNEFSVYRDRLIKRGILNGETRGRLAFSLPFFSDYVAAHADY